MFEQLEMNRYERILRNSTTGGRIPLTMAGVSRALRVTWEDSSVHQSLTMKVAAGVVAPVVFLYVWWLLLDAHSRGLKKLFFLARDGEIFWKVASRLVDLWSLGVEVVYLQCSRESLLLPSFTQMGNFERNWITWGYRNEISLAEICRRVNIKLEDLSTLAAYYGLSCYLDDIEREIAPQDRSALMNLINNSDFNEMVSASSTPLFAMTLAISRRKD